VSVACDRGDAADGLLLLSGRERNACARPSAFQPLALLARPLLPSLLGFRSAPPSADGTVLGKAAVADTQLPAGRRDERIFRKIPGAAENRASGRTLFPSRTADRRRRLAVAQRRDRRLYGGQPYFS